MIVGLENYYKMIDNNKSFEISDLHNRKHKFMISAGSKHYIHIDTSTGDSQVVHKDTIKKYIDVIFEISH